MKYPAKAFLETLKDAYDSCVPPLKIDPEHGEPPNFTDVIDKLFPPIDEETNEG